MIPYGSLVVFVTPKGRRYIKKLESGKEWHNNDGVLAFSEVAQANYGDVIHTSLGMPVRVEEATLYDRLMGIKRQTQIIYPKDIGYICLRLGAGNGRLILEAGCGSGGLTLALSWFTGSNGRIKSFDIREEFVKLARKNLEWAGVGENVEIFHKDIAEGFDTNNADALFLDVREPWLYLSQAFSAVKNGATLAFLVPTVNQVSTLIGALEQMQAGEVEVSEIMIRHWKPLADRIRPQDRMTAHTGFLIFCRQETKNREFENWLPRDTRERKQDQAKKERLEKMDAKLNLP